MVLPEITLVVHLPVSYLKHIKIENALLKALSI